MAIKKPGVSLTLGLSQTTGRPYAAVTGRAGALTARKRVDIFENAGILGVVAAGLLLYASSKKKKAKA